MSADRSFTPPRERTGRRWASLDEGATYLGCSVKTLRRLIAAGQLAAYRVGPRMVRIDLDELDAQFRPINTAAGAEL